MARPTTGSLPTMTMVIGVEAFRRIDGPMGRSTLAGEFGSSPLGTRLLSSFSTPSCPGIAAYLSTREPRLAGYTAVNSIRILSTGITVLLGGEPAHLPSGTSFVVTGYMPLGRSFVGRMAAFWVVARPPRRNPLLAGEETQLDGSDRGLGTVGDTELGDDVSHVVFDGAGADHQPSGDLLVG